MESIPAYAGLYLVRDANGKSICKYPRIRGVVSEALDAAKEVSPVSPHTRGCIVISPLRGGVHASIPAYAGLYLTRSNCGKTFPKYPRIRGVVSVIAEEALFARSKYPRIRGVVSNRSCGGTAIPPVSPHTRGCINQLAVRITFHDSIPAYAGLYRQDVSIFGGM